nr:MAG: hypothetical protein [Chemarfal virus 114]
MSKSYRWCLTLNNFTEVEYQGLKACDCKYLVLGKEVGESGTPHIQGFIIFAGQQRLSAVRKISARAHWEVTKGTARQASDYCKKDGDFLEVGVCPDTAAVAGGAAESSRWEESRKRAREGKLDDIPADIYIKYYRTLKEIAKDNMPKVPDAEGVTGVWIYGGPGVGKSRKAREDYPGAYLKMQNKWWDGYQGEEYVILDDFDSKELGHHLKIWCDRYSFVAETKGGAICIRPKVFVITSNYSIDDPKFDWDEEMRTAIKRRFKVVHMLPPLQGSGGKPLW